MPSSLSSRSVQYVVVDLLPYIGQATPLGSVWEMALPVDEKCEWDLMSATLNPGSTAVADAGGVTVAFDKVDSGAGTTTAILAATSIVAGAFPHDVPAMLTRGRTSFVSGDHLKMTFATDGALTTPAVGASMTFEFEITERSGV